jgi:hypothetical protein
MESGKKENRNIAFAFWPHLFPGFYSGIRVLSQTKKRAALHCAARFSKPGETSDLVLLHLFDLAAEVFLGRSQFLLQAPQPFVFLAVGKGEIVIGKLTVFLLQLAFELVPVAFDV